jgi:hypothetical protein
MGRHRGQLGIQTLVYRCKEVTNRRSPASHLLRQEKAMKHRNTSVIVAAIAVVAMFIPANDAHAATPPAGGVKASYNGRTLDLSKSWEDARACNVTANGTTCYATEAAMDAAVASSPPSRVAAGTCSTALRLYDGTSFTGQALNVYATQTTVALSGLGFASRTSSYRIGACSATLRAGSSVYPGTTAPNVSSGSMLAGWNNTITSVQM